MVLTRGSVPHLHGMELFTNYFLPFLNCMKKTTLVVLMVLVIVGAFYYAKKKGSVEEFVGVDMYVMPAFSLTDTDGNTVSSADLIGTPLVVNSWAAWCPFCKKELPDFAHIQEEFGDDVIFVAINRSESLDVVSEYSDKLGVTGKMIMLLDPDDSFYDAIGGFSMPETLLVNREGFVVTHRRGPMSLSETRDRVAELINRQ